MPHTMPKSPEAVAATAARKARQALQQTCTHELWQVNVEKQTWECALCGAFVAK
jgi:hypothetical protein